MVVRLMWACSQPKRGKWRSQSANSYRMTLAQTEYKMKICFILKETKIERNSDDSKLYCSVPKLYSSPNEETKLIQLILKLALKIKILNFKIYQYWTF